jgi:hypothetical protein
MAKNQTIRIRPAVLLADRESLAGLQAVSGYAPSNPSLSTSALNTLKTELDAAQAAEANADALAAAARDDATAKEWAFHNAVIGMRDQVMAQFGRDSNEAQSVGRKKGSERKPPTKASKKAPPTQ